jgi:acyl-CoA hydrolase
MILEQDPAKAASRIIDIVGRDLVMAVPVAIGKPNNLLNALYRTVEADRRLSLKLFTGLTLVRPRFRNDLQRRFAEPIVERMFEGYPDLLYAEATRAGKLPPNVEVHEFFVQAGAWLDNASIQRNFVSLAYANAARHLERSGINVFAQLVAPPVGGGDRLSLGSNPDIALDLADYVQKRRTAGPAMVLAGEINANMPYMPGEAERERSGFDVLLEPPTPHYPLFALTRQPVSLPDYAMALHVATLVKDGGTLQIGIGSFADAITHALILRHTRNAEFQTILRDLGGPLALSAETSTFEKGLYACSEMLVDGFLALRSAGVLKRRVLAKPISLDGFENPAPRPALIHAGFFFGHRELYEALKAMPSNELDEIQMTAISFTNTLRGNTQEKIRQRAHARFINSGMIATLLGAVSSDQLEDGRVVSGVGGQFDFVTMAEELPGARSILAVRATRKRAGRTSSNIVWRYGNTTIPRHLRDVIVTEYGIADLRGKSDRDVIAAMLSISDASFAPGLRKEAIHSGKLEPGFTFADAIGLNRRERVEAALVHHRRSGLLPAFPFGTQLTETEQQLIEPLDRLNEAGPFARASLLARGLLMGERAESYLPLLGRLGLDKVTTLEGRFERAVIAGALAASETTG